MVDNEERARAVREGDQSAVIGNDGDRHRAGPGEGVRAPLVSEGADHAEFSVFDGKGNESVVVVGADSKGRTSQGTGASSEEAAANTADTQLGEGFGPPGDYH
jgi:hypothetical protein